MKEKKRKERKKVLSSKLIVKGIRKKEGKERKKWRKEERLAGLNRKQVSGKSFQKRLFVYRHYVLLVWLVVSFPLQHASSFLCFLSPLLLMPQGVVLWCVYVLPM